MSSPMSSSEKTIYYVISAAILILAITFSTRTDAAPDTPPPEQEEGGATLPYTPENCYYEYPHIQAQQIDDADSVVFKTKTHKVQMKLNPKSPPLFRYFSRDKNFELRMAGMYQGIDLSDYGYGGVMSKYIHLLSTTNWSHSEPKRICNPDTRFEECVQMNITYTDKTVHSEEPHVQLTMTVCQRDLQIKLDVLVEQVNWKSKAKHLGICFSRGEIQEMTGSFEINPLKVIYQNEEHLFFGSDQAPGISLPKETYFRVSKNTAFVQHTQQPVKVDITYEVDKAGSPLLCMLYQRETEQEIASHRTALVHLDMISPMTMVASHGVQVCFSLATILVSLIVFVLFL